MKHISLKHSEFQARSIFCFLKGQIWLYHIEVVPDSASGKILFHNRKCMVGLQVGKFCHVLGSVRNPERGDEEANSSTSSRTA